VASRGNLVINCVSLWSNFVLYVCGVFCGLVEEVLFLPRLFWFVDLSVSIINQEYLMKVQSSARVQY